MIHLITLHALVAPWMRLYAMQARINAMVQVGMHNKDVKGDAV